MRPLPSFSQDIHSQQITGRARAAAREGYASLQHGGWHGNPCKANPYPEQSSGILSSFPGTGQITEGHIFYSFSSADTLVSDYGHLVLKGEDTTPSSTLVKEKNKLIWER